MNVEILTCLLCRQPFAAQYYACLRRKFKDGKFTGRYLPNIVCPAVCPDCGGCEVWKR